MALGNMIPFRFNPRGVADALDGGQTVPGACAALVDLIFDPSNPFTLQCRPASVEKPAFTGFTPGIVSVAYQIGDICFGMVSSGTDDVPFAFDVTNNTLLTVTGVTGLNVPAAQGITGDWTPPTMALVGVKLYVTHPGFSGANFFGYFDVTIPSAPTWTAGNTTGFALPFVPVSVAQFNNRAWFGLPDGNVVYTDALTTNVTSAAQTLTIGDSTPVTAVAPMPLTTSVQGIIGALVVFKANVIAFITGDQVDNNLAINIISSTIGTEAPRSISQTPEGLAFIATDGMRIIGQNGVIGNPDPFLSVPFIFAINKSRMSGCYSSSIYRISVQNGFVTGQPIQEYWYDFSRGGWNGPHSFKQSMAVAYKDDFVVFSNTNPDKLYVSETSESNDSLFVENGTPMSWLFRTSPLPDDGGMYENSATLSVIDMQLPFDGSQYTFTASDIRFGVLSSAVITAPIIGGLWGATTWLGSVWNGFLYGMDRYNIPWTKTLIFSRMILQATGPSSFNFKLGKLTVGYQPLNYVRTS